MVGFYLTEVAHEDLVDIAVYTFDRWGGEQERLYVAALFTCFSEIVENDKLGRACDDLGEGLRRVGQGSHIVYFRKVGDEIEIVRILHKRMLPEKHLKF